MVYAVEIRREIEFEGQKILFTYVGVLAGADKMFCLSGGSVVRLESLLGITYHANMFSVFGNDAMYEMGPELVQIAMKGDWAIV